MGIEAIVKRYGEAMRELGMQQARRYGADSVYKLRAECYERELLSAIELARKWSEEDVRRALQLVVRKGPRKRNAGEQTYVGLDSVYDIAEGVLARIEGK